ncbi:MAG: hypothetical protein OTJ97_04545, partial [SAR202 cluster bacterium]|nr:hypothetical protein [SAR202 cluster bacterium]
GCLHGECSLLAFTALLSPARVLTFFELGLNRQVSELFQVADEIDSVVEALYRPVADLPLVDGAYDKILARASGVEMPLRMLSPYEGCDITTYEACIASLRQAAPRLVRAGLGVKSRDIGVQDAVDPGGVEALFGSTRKPRRLISPMERSLLARTPLMIRWIPSEVNLNSTSFPPISVA